MLVGAVIGLFVALVFYEIVRRDKPWDAGRVARILIGGAMALFVLMQWGPTSR